MSRTAHEDLERGNNADGDGYWQPAPDQQQWPSEEFGSARIYRRASEEEDKNRVGQTQPPLNHQSQPSQGESSFGDSSGPFFSIYSKAAEEEDNKMVERWQKDADGILIFTGLFSAAVAALLAVTIQDLRPNSQDTSAFYLGNIYGVLADPNATRTSIPSPVAKPPLFSPPRSAVLVNLLWFLSLVISLSCALLATSLHQWARRYIRLTQPARCSPEKRARLRAFFADGVDNLQIPWAVEGLPTLLHLSLFLFFGGLVVFLFNVDQEVFIGVVTWIGIFSMMYGSITLLPLIRQDSPYFTPLSKPAWIMYARIQYVTFKVLTSTFWKGYGDLKDRYRGWVLRGLEKTAEETAEKLSSMTDLHILGWTVSALGDDDSLETFIEAIPGFFNSKLVKDLRDRIPNDLLKSLSGALDGFLDRTLSSNLVIDSVKLRRLGIFLNAMDLIRKDRVLSVLRKIKFKHWNLGQVLITVEMGHTLAHWCKAKDKTTAQCALSIVTGILVDVQRRDDRWVKLAANVFGLRERTLLDNIAHSGESALLAILIQVIRQYLSGGDVNEDVLDRLSELRIRDTPASQQHEFCVLWNKTVQESRKGKRYFKFIHILHSTRYLYATLHQGTDVAWTPTNDMELKPWVYPICHLASHRPGSDAHVSISKSRALCLPTEPGDPPDAPSHHSDSGGSIVSRQVEEASIGAGRPSPSDLTTRGKIGGTSQVSVATPSALPSHTSPLPSDASPQGAVVAALQDIPPATTLSYSLEGTLQQDMVALCAERDIYQICYTSPTPTLTEVPMPISALPVLNQSRPASTSDSLLLTPSVVGSIPAFPSPSCVTTLPHVESLTTLSSPTSIHPSDNTALSRLRPRGLVNTGRMCFANAVLQLLVHSPPFWNLFRDVGDLKGRRGAGGPKNDGIATPLVDATVRFFEEFLLKEKELPQTQRAAKRKLREDEEHNSVDSFEPTYMHDAMKKKRQLKNLLDGKDQDSDEFLGLYLDALDEELADLRTLIDAHKPAFASSVKELGEEFQSAEGQTEVGERDYTANSPISRIFGGRSCSTVRAPHEPDTITVEHWRLLRLNIQPDSVCTIQDALTHLSQRQPVQVGQSSSSNATQQVLLEALPPALVLHLGRFQYDAATNGTNKISKPVQFTPELEIPLEIMVPVAGKSAEPVRYKLRGVLYHHGESAGSGHYTVDVLHQNGDGGSGEAWLHIDDEAVSAVRHADVFGGHDNSRADDSCAYMLFYCRTDST